VSERLLFDANSDFLSSSNGRITSNTIGCLPDG
jgi:hypothetical protein